MLHKIVVLFGRPCRPIHKLTSLTIPLSSDSNAILDVIPDIWNKKPSKYIKIGITIQYINKSMSSELQRNPKFISHTKAIIEM